MLAGFQQITPTDARKQSDTKNGVILGSAAVTRDGKVYRWARAGATGLAVGKLNVNSNADSNVVNKTVARTYAAGVTSVIVDAAGTVVADAYVDGYFTVSDATGEGFNCLVVGNTGVTGAGEITLTLAEPTPVALTIDVSEYTLTRNDFDDVVISVIDQLDMPVGVPNIAITADYYFWSQVYGNCSVLADASTHARGSLITISAATAGAIGLKDAAGEANVGIANEIGVSTEYRSQFLTIG
jgi:hypothetical protein